MTIHQMDILNKSGHLSVNWDPDDEQEVAAARATFEEMTRKGYSAFRAGADKGGRGAKLHSFDKHAEEMVLIPPIQGG